jgi:hypothetical protein
MTIAPSLRRSSLLCFFATQGAGSSTIIDGKLCLLYFGGLFLGLGRFSSSASAKCLEETQQRLDKKPIANSVTRVREVVRSEYTQGKEPTWGGGEWKGWVVNYEQGIG